MSEQKSNLLSKFANWRGCFKQNNGVEPTLYEAYLAGRATQPQAPQGGGWQPIETAPKDGSVIVAYWSAELDGAPVTGDHCYALTLWGGGDWISADLSDISFGEPTHWQPLPTAPTETPEAGK